MAKNRTPQTKKPTLDARTRAAVERRQSNAAGFHTPKTAYKRDKTWKKDYR